MKTLSPSDFFIFAIVIVWLWMRKQARDEKKPTPMESEIDSFKTNLEAQFETPWQKIAE